jgi:hypothetical protein
MCRSASPSFTSYLSSVAQEEGVKSPRTFAFRRTASAVTALILVGTHAPAQESASTRPASPQNEATITALEDLQEQVRQLRTLVEQVRTENAESRTEMHKLRQELRNTRELLVSSSAISLRGELSAAAAEPKPAPPTDLQAESAVAGDSAPSTQNSSRLDSRVQKLEEATQLLGSKVDEQYQTKVETASKYHARLSGIVLMNAFRNHGASNNLDFPDFARPNPPGSPASSFGATMRQSEIGLEIFGPTLAGAKSSANVQLDFAGGFPSTPNGVNFGIARLQTGAFRLDWQHTSVVAGQDTLFVSPLSPTSFASLATPAFAYAGNLWGWTPQLRLEHRFNFSDQQTVTVQAGILDNLNWEPPYDQFYRTLQAGERSGQPAYGIRTSWSRPVFDHPLSIGVAGYYGRQNWNWDRYADSWAGMTDWQIPLLRRLTLSGEFYRGRGIGGLGAGIGRAVVFGGGGDPGSATTPIRGLDSAGGWSQLKLQLTSKLEINGVFAEDNAFASEVRGFATDQNNFTTILGRNRGGLGNLVYRPRSDLLFSAEFRRLRSFPVYSNSSVTNQVNLAMGILF